MKNQTESEISLKYIFAIQFNIPISYRFTTRKKIGLENSSFIVYKVIDCKLLDQKIVLALNSKLKKWWIIVHTVNQSIPNRYFSEPSCSGVNVALLSRNGVGENLSISLRSAHSWHLISAPMQSLPILPKGQRKPLLNHKDRTWQNH